MICPLTFPVALVSKTGELALYDYDSHHHRLDVRCECGLGVSGHLEQTGRLGKLWRHRSRHRDPRSAPRHDDLQNLERRSSMKRVLMFCLLVATSASAQ